jgi:hypothetical protein
MNPLHTHKLESAPLPLDRQRKSGFVLKPIDAGAARNALRQMAEEADTAECQQTLEELMQSLNETRAEAGERVLFP